MTTHRPTLAAALTLALLGGAIIVGAVIVHMLLDARLKKAAKATI